MTLQDTLHHTEQIANAIQRRDKHYTLEVSEAEGWLVDEIHIELPTPQRAGTMTQQRSYAVDKAQELLEALNK